MRVIKPLELSVQIRPFEFSRQKMLAIGVHLAQPFDARRALFSEQDLWTLAAQYLSEWDVYDEGMPKPVGEYLVYGSYYGSVPMAADHVQVQVGSLSKTLKVIGRRQWRTSIGSTNAEALSTLPIRYDVAYGGAQIKANPVGIGADALLLPQIEHPDDPFNHPNQPIVSAGFTARNILWSPRQEKWGTYSGRWQETDAPGFAKDIDWTIFNLAPEDQWLKAGFWQGGEPFKVRNMHPQQPILEGQLGQWRIRLFVLKAEQLFELTAKFETCWLFPTEQVQTGCYRAQCTTDTFDGSEINALLVAYEDPLGPEKTVQHYADALTRRLAPEGDIEDPDDLALRPNGEPLSVLHPPEPSLVPEVVLPGAAAGIGLGALAALAKMKGGKGGAEAEAAVAAEAKVDDASATELSVGSAAPADGAVPANVENNAQAPASETDAAPESPPEDPAVAEAMADLDALMELMADQIASADALMKKNRLEMGLTAELMAGLSDEGGIDALLKEVLPAGSPTADVINDPSALQELLAEPARMMEAAQEAGLNAGALAEHKELIEAILQGTATPEDVEALLEKIPLETAAKMMAEANLESGLDPAILTAIKKATGYKSN